MTRPHMLLLLSALAAGPAHAAGYYTSDIGVRSFSRGGAFVAGADDITAMWYNPAALIRMKDGQLTLDVAGVGMYVYFDRDDYEGAGVDENGDTIDLINDPVENLAPYFVIPHLGAAWDFGLPNTVFAVGFYPPYAPDLEYDPDGPQRYSLTGSAVVQTFTGISAAHRFADLVTVGGGVSWNYLYVEQELAVTLLTDLDVERPDYDVSFRLDGTDPFALAWNLGLLVEPDSGAWAVGAMMQAPTAFQTTGTMDADFSENFYYTDAGIIGQPSSHDDNVSLEVSMPLILKAGALVRPSDSLEIEVSGVYEGWSIIEQIVVTEVDMAVDLEGDLFEDVLIEDDIILPAGYQDTFSVRLGGEFALNDTWTFRAGGLFETGAIPAAVQSVSLVDGNKYGYGGGASWRPKPKLEFDAGAFQSWIPSKQITDSELHMILVDPLTGEVSDGRVIGDGTLAAHFTIFGGGLNWYFGS